MGDWRSLQQSNQTSSDEDNISAAESWQPIYAALILTLIQVIIFLIIFECSRRSKYVGYVFDRRRFKRPTRTPPPLMQRRGLCRGWLAFEWWRLRVSDKEYRNRSIQEEQDRRRRAREQETKQHPNKERDEAIVKEAERICYEQSPFRDPSRDEDLELAVATGDNLNTSADHDVKEVEDPSNELAGREACTKGSPLDKETTVAFEGIEPLNAENEPDNDDASLRLTSDALKTFTEESTSPTEEKGMAKKPRPQSILKSRSAQSEPRPSKKELADEDIPSNPPHRRSQSLDVGGSQRSQRSVRFGQDRTQHQRHGRSDSFFGTIEAERLAKLRWEKEDTSTWDLTSLSTATSAAGRFVKNRVLKMETTQDDDPPTNAPSSQSSGLEHFVARKAVRRSLTREQQELLRCIGLDAFMTLRFLEFGLDVSLWPFLLSLVTLIPLYKTGRDDLDGFVDTTVLALEEGSARHWMVVVFSIVQFSYILRRLWIEWELFLPLRYDFLGNGDFEKKKYQGQYRRTCIVEYVPPTHKNDSTLYEFFDAIFPGQVRRAEVLLNTEHLRSLIRRRQTHIMGFEDYYAKKVHQRAQYMRDVGAIERSGPIVRCCRKINMPREPREPMIIVIRSVPREDTGNIFIHPQSKEVRDATTHEALAYHHQMIQLLNKEIEDEFLRLARGRRRKTKQKSETRLSRWLGLNYLTSSETGCLHSSTAFVEFNNLVVKQQAIQSNVTGIVHYMEISAVPDVKDLTWDNAHVSEALINTRRVWANLVLGGGLIGWSFLVSTIRSYDRISSWFNWNLESNEFVKSIFDFYLPALIVEGLVRLIPFVIKAGCIWIRFKATSKRDHYILRWYFCYRCFTFIFIIIGGDLVDSTEELVGNPIKFIERLADSVAEQASFFISYVSVAGGIQIFFRLSQVFYVLTSWFTQKVRLEESVSQRRLDQMRNSEKVFHMDEFIPLFIFVFMVGALYGSLAPLASIFVAAFFKCAYKVFKYMNLFIYVSPYEGGGFLFYTLSTILFSVLYIIILIIAGYLSLHGIAAMAIVSLLMIPVVVVVQLGVQKTFVMPSKTLSLTNAVISDNERDKRSKRERKLQEFFRAKMALKQAEEEEENQQGELEAKLLPRSSDIFHGDEDYPAVSGTGAVSGSEEELDSYQTQRAIERIERRYKQEDSLSDVTESDGSGPSPDFFVYRQPSLNRATWEVNPRPYRYTIERDDVEVWR